MSYYLYLSIFAQYGTNPQNQLSAVDQKNIVKYFNGARSSTGSPPLIWDAKMESAGVQCLQTKSNGQMEHGICGDSIGEASGYGSAGENIASGGSGASAALMFISEICEIRSWTDLLTPGGYNFESGVGHYSQVVWNSSKKLSCVQVEKNGVIYCHFAPAGNMIASLKPPISKIPDTKSVCPNGRFDSKAWITQFGNGQVPVQNGAPTAPATPKKPNYAVPAVPKSPTVDKSGLGKLFHSDSTRHAVDILVFISFLQI